MSDYIKVSGKTVEDALLEASIQLQTSSDNIEYNVVEKESKGFLGIGAKKAVIEARVKKTDEEIVNEIFAGRQENKGASAKHTKAADSRTAKRSVKPEEKKPAEPPEKAVREKAVRTEKTEKSVKESENGETAQTTETPSEVHRSNRGSGRQDRSRQGQGRSGQNRPERREYTDAENADGNTVSAQRPARKNQDSRPKVPADPEEAKRRAHDFLTQLFDAMGIEASITEEFEDGNLSVNLEGNDMGVLIGKRGQTLDSIQFLTSLVVNKGKASYVRVKIDTENYRERRKATLENLARNMAVKVKRTGRPVYLEPMNPYERRIIHSALQSDPYVTTHSEGEDPCRKVVIVPKKREDEREDEEE